MRLFSRPPPAHGRAEPAPPRIDWRANVPHSLTMPTHLAQTEQARAALIGAIAAASDRSAFIALFEFYAPRIKAQALRFGFDDAAAEDVVQEAMLAVWQRAAQFDPARGTASAWIFSIAANARIDRLRRDKRLTTALDIDLLTADLAYEPDETGAESAGLASIIAALPSDQQQIVHLSFYADLPQTEIATRLGIPLGTVKSRMRLAMSKLRQALSLP